MSIQTIFLVLLGAAVFVVGTTNIRAYLITALYNAPSTMSHYYQQEVQHDMYGGGWAEKGIT